MSHIRLLYLAITAGIGGCLYRSILHKWPNVFKVTAHTQSHQSQSLKYCDVSTSTVVKPRGHPFIRTPGPRKWAPTCDCTHPRNHHPTIFDLDTENVICDVKVCRNVTTGLPNWTLEVVNSEVLGGHHGCRYCRYRASLNTTSTCPKVAIYDNDVEFQRRFCEYCKYDLDPCVFHALPPQVHRENCQSNALWDDFYHYVVYLAKKYDSLSICSGPCFTPRELTDEEKEIYSNCSGAKLGEITHFFKVLLIEDECEKPTFWFECFLFPIDTRCVDNPNIMHYRVKKEEIEQMVDVSILPEVTKCWLTEGVEHKDFSPHRNCRICFPSQDAPTSPWHSEPSYCAHTKSTPVSQPHQPVSCRCKDNKSKSFFPCRIS